MARRGLGRGLDALIRTGPAEVAGPGAAGGAASASPPAAPGRVPAVELDLIDPSPWQPRRVFDQEKLQALADSIQEQGLVQPVVVRRRGERFEVIAGERRLRAIRSLGWQRVPAVVMDAADARMRELALVENLQRDDLNPLEVAAAYQALRQEIGCTHEQIAARLGVSRAQITNTLRLLELPEEVKSLVSAGLVSAGHARAVLSLADAESQVRLARRIARDGLSVRQVERMVSGGPGRSGPKKGQREKRDHPEIRDLEDRLRSHLGTKVTVADQGGKGNIVIEYYSHDDFARLLGRIGVSDDLP